MIIDQKNMILAIGLSVLVAWLVLGFVYGWKGQATWVDRAGRAVGLAWLVLAPLGLVLHLVRGIAVLQG